MNTGKKRGGNVDIGRGQLYILSLPLQNPVTLSDIELDIQNTLTDIKINWQ
jgi:hypothetical protein